MAILIGVILSSLIVGALARIALPGPDPMPIWATIALGFLGSVVGGVVAAFVGVADQDAGTATLFGFALSLAGAVLLLVAYRKGFQKRPVSGPDAQRYPLRPRGLRRLATRRPHRFVDDTAEPGHDPVEQLRQLVALRDAGRISADEYEQRKARLVDAI